jgi:hypothetical protein
MEITPHRSSGIVFFIVSSLASEALPLALTFLISLLYLMGKKILSSTHLFQGLPALKD